jgi:5'-methylthioadenosine phosphorylase
MMEVGVASPREQGQAMMRTATKLRKAYVREGWGPKKYQMRKVAIEAAKKLGMKFHGSGTVVVIQGPRFSTKAESKFFRRQGWDVINMTQYPEAVLAREQELCYLNVSVVTDYDAGLEGDPRVKPVSHHEVIRVFERNMERLKSLIFEIAERLPQERTCRCSSALEDARLST